MGEDIEVRRRRAVWRAGHRGTKELDLLVGRFAAAHLACHGRRRSSRASRRFWPSANRSCKLGCWRRNQAGGETEFADIVDGDPQVPRAGMRSDG